MKTLKEYENAGVPNKGLRQGSDRQGVYYVWSTDMPKPEDKELKDAIIMKDQLTQGFQQANSMHPNIGIQFVLQHKEQALHVCRVFKKYIKEDIWTRLKI